MSFPEGDPFNHGMPSSTVVGTRSSERGGILRRRRTPAPAKIPKPKLTRDDPRPASSLHDRRADVDFGFRKEVAKSLLLARDPATGISTRHPFRNAVDTVRWHRDHVVPIASYKKGSREIDGQLVYIKGYESQWALFTFWRQIKGAAKIAAVALPALYAGAYYFAPDSSPKANAAATADAGFIGKLINERNTITYTEGTNPGVTHTVVCQQVGKVSLRAGEGINMATRNANENPAITTQFTLAENNAFTTSLANQAQNHIGFYAPDKHPYTPGTTTAPVAVTCTQTA